MVAVLLIAAVALFLVEVVALADVIGHTDADFRAVARGTRTVWIGVLLTAMGISILFGGRSVLSLIGVVAAAFYLLDVRPRLRRTP